MLIKEIFNIVEKNGESIIMLGDIEEFEGIKKGTFAFESILNSFDKDLGYSDCSRIHLIEETEEKIKELKEIIPFINSSVIMLINDEGIKEAIKLS